MPKNLTYALWRDCHMNYCPNSQLKHALESATLWQHSGADGNAIIEKRAA